MSNFFSTHCLEKSSYFDWSIPRLFNPRALLRGPSFVSGPTIESSGTGSALRLPLSLFFGFGNAFLLGLRFIALFRIHLPQDGSKPLRTSRRISLPSIRAIHRSESLPSSSDLVRSKTSHWLSGEM